MSTTQTQPTTRLGQSAARMLAGAGVMMILAVVGFINPGNFVLLDRFLNHPLVFMIAAVAFLAASVFFIVTRVVATARPLSRVLKGILASAQLALVATVMVMVSLLAIAFLWMMPTGPSSAVSAPMGHAYEAVIQEDTAVIGPIWYITIRQDSGLFARAWEVGCLSGDDPANGLGSVRWDGPERLIIQTVENGRVVVDVSAETGYPIRIQDQGILGCP